MDYPPYPRVLYLPYPTYRALPLSRFHARPTGTEARPTDPRIHRHRPCASSVVTVYDGGDGTAASLSAPRPHSAASPGKSASRVACRAAGSRAITTVRGRLSCFKSPALVLRGGEDIANHEQHGTADLWRGASKDAPLTFISYPGHGHDVVFDGCRHGLTMAAKDNRVVDDIVAWLKREMSYGEEEEEER